jgi:hypothetical protein
MSPTGIYYCLIPDAYHMDQILYIGLYASPNNGIHVVHIMKGLWYIFNCGFSLGAQLESINFELTSDDAVLVTYSLTCTSNGGPISTMWWARDGGTLDEANIYPSLTSHEAATYTSTIREVSGRQTGMYTCTATDGGGTLSLSESLTVEGT